MVSSLPGTSVPSPAPSNASNGQKRKRDGLPPRRTAVELTRDAEYRPQETLGQVQIAIQHLKETQQAKSFDELLRYMSLQHADATAITKLEQTMKAGRHPKINYDPKTDKFKYKPIIDVFDPESLKKYLQQRKNMIGVKVEDVKDGWPDCNAALEEMAKKGEILLVRTGTTSKKSHNLPFSNNRDETTHQSAAKLARDALPKTIWASDSTLLHTVPEDLRTQWHAIPLPGSDEQLREKLLKEGLKPATAPPVHNAGPTGRKKRKVRRNAKGTATNVNVPMRDYSHLRK
jgi:transcription initiation factor TFIIE subunit beta